MDQFTTKWLSSPLRVLYLIDSLGSGGAQRQLTTLLSALDRRVVKPRVAVYQPFWHFRQSLDRIGVPIHSLGNLGARDPRVTFRLARLLWRGNFDIIHSYLRTPGILARAVGALRPNTKIIISERSTDLDHSTWRFLLERILANRGDAMIANAESIKVKVEALIPKWRGRVHMIPNGIAFTEITKEIRCRAIDFRDRYVATDEQILVGVVARLGPEKDPYVLIDALQRLPHKILSRLRIVWVGSLWNRNLFSSITKKINESKLSDSIFFVPEMQQIRVVYQAIDALALTSRREGFPNVVLEALAEGIPVIATDVGDVRFLVDDGKCGWVVPPRNPEALADAFEKLVKAGRAHRSLMGRSGFNKVRHLYSSEKMAQRTLDVYEKVL